VAQIAVGSAWDVRCRGSDDCETVTLPDGEEHDAAAMRMTTNGIAKVAGKIREIVA
jgi:hypothetical protein